MLVISACCGNTAVHKADREVKEHATDYPECSGCPYGFSTADDVLQIHIRERARLFSMLSHGPSFCNPAM